MYKRRIMIGILMIFSITVKAQTLTEVSGVVHNKNGKSISGAVVYFLNTNFTTSTDDHGNFYIKNVPRGKYSVRISAEGYATSIKVVDFLNSLAVLEFQLTESGNQLDEVVVSAQKQDDNPQQLPFSISTLSARQVNEYKLWDAKDITAIVPNLYSASPGDHRNVTSIRGITTTSYDPAVATYIDGVNQFGLDTYIAQLQDIERIEVLRGPQGTLYGRNAMGGVINIITKQPDNETHGFIELNAGNYNQFHANIGLRTPLIKNKLFFGVSGLFTQQDGFYTNNFYKERFDDQHSMMGNYYLKFLANSKLSFNLNIKHAENRNQGVFPLAPDKATALENPFTVDQNSKTQLVDNIFNASLSLKYAGNKFNFTSQSTYQSNYRYYTDPIDGDFSPIDGISLINNYGKDWNNVKVGTQEIRFSSPANSSASFKWIAGSYAFYQNNPVKQGTHFGKDAILVGAPFPDFTDIAINKLNRYGLAVFGQGTYSIITDLDLTIGIRYDYEHNKQGIAGEFQMDGEAPVVTRTDTSSKVGFKAFSPKVSLIYIINPATNVYMIYSRGFRAGGISQLSSDPDLPPLIAYHPESSNNFEAGLKNSFYDNRLLLNFTLFYTKVNDAQVPTLILPDAITITRNAGKLNSKGVELEMALKPVNGLELNANFGYTDARYTTLNLSSNRESVNLNGNRQVFTPEVTSLTALQYSYNLKTPVSLIVRGEWKYLGKQYFDLANQIDQDAFHTFNTRLGISSKGLSAFFWGTNLLNKRYIDYAYDFGAAHLGNPRTYGISLSASF